MVMGFLQQRVRNKELPEPSLTSHNKPTREPQSSVLEGGDYKAVAHNHAEEDKIFPRSQKKTTSLM